MQAVDFEYDGRLLSELGMEIVQFDSGSGFDTTTAGSQLSLDTFPVNGGREHRLVAAHYDDVFTATISICKPDGATISIDEYRYIMHWLNRKTNLKLTILFDGWENIHFYGTFNEIEKVEHRGRLVGFTMSFQSNAPFGWSNQKAESFELTETGYHTIDDDSDEYGSFPFDYMEITCNASGDLALENHYDNRVTQFRDCQSGEVIVIDGKTMTIVSSTGRNIYDSFNFVYPKLVSTTNIDEFTGHSMATSIETLEEQAITTQNDGSLLIIKGIANVYTSTLPCSINVLFTPMRKVVF